MYSREINDTILQWYSGTSDNIITPLITNCKGRFEPIRLLMTLLKQCIKDDNGRGT